FLGFTLVCSKSRRGRFLLKRRSRRDRLKSKLKDVSNELRHRMHQSIPEQGNWLKQVVTGYFAYHAVPTNSAALVTFRDEIIARWRWVLHRRSQKSALTWARMTKLADDWLPKPNILHPWPSDRFAVTHPRWEPYAGKPPVRFCAGGAMKIASLPLQRREFITLLGGAAATWPLAARAQQAARVPRIGIVDDAPMWHSFRQALREFGYVEGQSVNYEYRYSKGVPERLATAVVELV